MQLGIVLPLGLVSHHFRERMGIFECVEERKLVQYYISMSLQINPLISIFPLL